MNNRRGLWLFPSYFNHACSGNSFFIILGDMMMIYTRRDVSKGEELTINYVSPLLKYSVRKEKFFNTFQFKCDCEMCQLDEMDLLRPKREELVGKIIFANKNQSISETVDDVNRIQQTYLQRTKFKYQLVYPLEYLALKYRASRMFAESAKCYEQIFDAIKDCNEFLAIASLKEAYVDYRKCSEIEKSNSCQTRAAEYFVNLKTLFDVVWEQIQLIW